MAPAPPPIGNATPATGRAVSATMASLREWLPRFETAVALTMNSAVTISETGSYAPPEQVGDPFTVVSHRVSLRIDPSALGPLVSCESDDPKQPDCLQLVSQREDRLLHRGFVSSAEDRVALASMTLPGRDGWQPSKAPMPTPRGARHADRSTDLAAADTAGHIDSILTEPPSVRMTRLEASDRAPSAQTSVQQLMHVLMHVAELRIPLTVAVPTHGLLHTSRGRLTSLRRTRHGVSMGLGAASLTVEPEALGETWVTRPAGGPAFFEQHDARGRCVLVIMPAARYASTAAIRWEHMTAMSSLHPVSQY